AIPPCSVPFGNSVTYLSGTPLISFMALAAAAASKGFTPLTILPPRFAAGATVFFIRSRRSFTAATKSSSAEIAAVVPNAMPTRAQTIIISCFCMTPLHSSELLQQICLPIVTATLVPPPWRKDRPRRADWLLYLRTRVLAPLTDHDVEQLRRGPAVDWQTVSVLILTDRICCALAIDGVGRAWVVAEPRQRRLDAVDELGSTRRGRRSVILAII